MVGVVSGVGGVLATISEVADHATSPQHENGVGGGGGGGSGCAERDGGSSVFVTPSVAVPLAELRAATGNFDEAAKVGDGGFASVYKVSTLGLELWSAADGVLCSLERC